MMRMSLGLESEEPGGCEQLLVDFFSFSFFFFVLLDSLI